MIDLFTLGNKYKKRFTAQFDGSKFFLKLFSNVSDNYIIDYHDGSYQNITTQKNGYLQIFKNDCLSGKLSIVYNNYDINGLCFCNNLLKKIVLQQMRHLKYLNVSVNNLKYLVLNNCSVLQNLIAYNNNITQIDLTKNNKLKYLDLSGNNIKYLDLTKNKQIEQLSINGNQIQQLYIPYSVKRLSVVGNKLKKIVFEKFSQVCYLNISDNIQLSQLEIDSNNIQKIVCKKTSLTTDSIILKSKTSDPNIIFY